MKYFLTLFLIFVPLSGCKNKPSTLVDSYDEQEMDAAIARARSEIDAFLAELSNPTGTDHAVKAPIVDGDETEHFWLIDVSFNNDTFTGTINNDPGLVSNVRIGQEWSLKKMEISDWMFMREGKIHGNYTMRPLLKGMPEDEAAKFRAMLAEP